MTVTSSAQSTSVVSFVLRLSVPFGLAMALLFSLAAGARTGIPAGAIAGLAFGVVTAAFVKVQSKRLMIPGELLEGERILYQGGVNHVRGAEARGGWLVLTERALVFRSHGLNVQNQPLRIELADVRGVAPARTMGIVPNGLLVEQRERAERFVVSQRAEWIRRIEARL